LTKRNRNQWLRREVAPGTADKDDMQSDAIARERTLMISAFAKAAAEHGIRALTIEDVARNAGLPTERFGACLGSKEAGLLAAQDVFLDRLRREIVDACADSEDWPHGVRMGLRSAIALLAERSGIAGELAIEETGLSLAAAERQLTAIDQFASLLREGRRRYPRADRLPELAERTLIGGVVSIISGCLLAEEPAALLVLEPQLAEMLLAPYVGEEEARRITGD
jgi:AcrR family transcriptional regulator